MPFFSSLPCPATSHPHGLSQGPTGLPMGQDTRQLSTYPTPHQTACQQCQAERSLPRVGGGASDVRWEQARPPPLPGVHQDPLGEGSEGRGPAAQSRPQRQQG